MAPATFNVWKEITGVEMINGLGISELLHIFISASGDDIKPGAIGKAVPDSRSASSTGISTTSAPTKSAR